jgi:hypothetical protein
MIWPVSTTPLHPGALLLTVVRFVISSSGLAEQRASIFLISCQVVYEFRMGGIVIWVKRWPRI